MLWAYRRAGYPIVDPVVDEDRAICQWEMVDQPWRHLDVLAMGQHHYGLFIVPNQILHADMNRGVVLDPLDRFEERVLWALRWTS